MAGDELRVEWPGADRPTPPSRAEHRLPWSTGPEPGPEVDSPPATAPSPEPEDRGPTRLRIRTRRSGDDRSRTSDPLVDAKAEIARLEREVSELRAELAALRATSGDDGSGGGPGRFRRR